jgi:hypothetical protein
MATYNTHGCNPGNTQIFLPNVTGPGVTSITVTKFTTSIQGTLSNGSANIYLNDTAFSSFKTFISSNPNTTVHFQPTSPIIPAPFSWP